MISLATAIGRVPRVFADVRCWNVSVSAFLVKAMSHGDPRLDQSDTVSVRRQNQVRLDWLSALG